MIHELMDLIFLVTNRKNLAPQIFTGIEYLGVMDSAAKSFRYNWFPSKI